MKVITLFAQSLILSLISLHSIANVSYSDEQRETIIEMTEQLEQRHYSKRRYDDELSSQHLDNYINSLDGGKMFFTATDIAEFEKYRLLLDDAAAEGNLDAGYLIFDRFQIRLQDRLNGLIEDLPNRIEAMDFAVEESYLLDTDDRAWA